MCLLWVDECSSGDKTRLARPDRWGEMFAGAVACVCILYMYEYCICILVYAEECNYLVKYLFFPRRGSSFTANCAQPAGRVHYFRVYFSYDASFKSWAACAQRPMFFFVIDAASSCNSECVYGHKSRSYNVCRDLRRFPILNLDSKSAICTPIERYLHR